MRALSCARIVRIFHFLYIIQNIFRKNVMYQLIFLYLYKRDSIQMYLKLQWIWLYTITRKNEVI